MTVVYDWRKVGRETLENLAHAMLTNSLDNGAFEHHTAGNDAYNAAVAALRNAVTEARPAPLRTRAEVDADIAHEVRCLPLPDQLTGEVVVSGITVQRLMALRAEPLAPDPNHTDVIQAPGFDGPCFKTLADARASTPDAPEPDRCSCEEALGLREKLQIVTRLLTATELDIHHALVNLK